MELKQLEENGELKSRMFCTHNLSGFESISFYTGFKYTSEAWNVCKFGNPV